VARYAAFGFQFDCEFDLPELARARESSAPVWHIETRQAIAPDDPPAALGSDTVYGDVHVRAFASASSFRLTFDDTGTFDVLANERRIVWYPGTRADAVAMRADLLGRVIALAAHADGALALHASAVSIDGEAIAFLGPKHAGKSTLALALANAGARLLTDDTLVVRLDGNGAAWAAPGVQRVRLWDDAARALAVQSHGQPGAKPTIDALAAARLETADVRLVACYVLHAADSDLTDPPVRRTEMASVHAALSCVRFSKLGALAGGRESAVVLDRAARLTATVSVFAADVCRDLTMLDRVAATFVAWQRASRHTGTMATSPTP
jgi:hypothetical protein